MVKFLIIGDLHGTKPNIFFKDGEFDAIIFPGDVCGDKALKSHKEKMLSSVKDLDDPYKLMETYLQLFEEEDYNKIEELEILEGRKILKYLCSFKKPVFFIPGNWDKSYGYSSIDESMKVDEFYHKKSILQAFYGKTNKKLIKGMKNLVDCQFKLNKFKGVNILGYGCSSCPESNSISNNFDKNKKKEIKNLYLKITNKLQSEYEKRDKNSPTIYLSHNMPKGIMDKILKAGSPVYGKRYGSNISKEFILKNNPLICVGAHMHEYLGQKKLGKTTVINAGFGTKVNTLIEIDEKTSQINSVKFISKDKRRDVNRHIGW